MTLRGKWALVTGASRGIGAAIAKTLAYEGSDVAITYEESAESAAEVVSAIKAKGRRGVAIQADSADAAAVQASVDTAVAEWVGLISSSTMQGFLDWASRQGGGMPIAITAAVARPWIIDPHDTIGNHCGMLSHQSLFKQLRLPLAQADRSLPP